VSLEDEPLLALFHPVEQFSIRSRYLVARTTADPGRTAGAVVREIQSLDVELPSMIPSRWSSDCTRRWRGDALRWVCWACSPR
jgi:hypothetical protein